MKEIVEQTAQALLKGGVILYPTDTIWGLGCDARNANAITKLYAIKERDKKKSMLVLCTDEMIDSDVIPKMSNSRPTTYILPKEIWMKAIQMKICPLIVAEDGSLGIRIVQHKFCQEVIRAIGAPLVSTSANMSGRPSPAQYTDIEEEIKRRVDYCVPPYDEFMSGNRCGSRIIKLDLSGRQTIIRT